MSDDVVVEAVGLGKGQFQHDPLAVGDGVELGQDAAFEKDLGLGLGRAVDVDLGLDDRNQAVGQDLSSEVELLSDVGGDTGFVRNLDDRAHLCSEHALGSCTLAELVEAWNRLHHL